MARTRARRSMNDGLLGRSPSGTGFSLSGLGLEAPEAKWILSGLVVLVILGSVSFVFWERLLETFGMAVAPGAAIVFLSLIVAYKRPRSLFTWAHRWLSVAALVALIFGCMAFFRTDSGILADATLGGKVGTAIIGSQNTQGVLRLIGIGIACIGLFKPRWAKRAVMIAANLLMMSMVLTFRGIRALIERIRYWYDLRHESRIMKQLRDWEPPRVPGAMPLVHRVLRQPAATQERASSMRAGDDADAEEEEEGERVSTTKPQPGSSKKRLQQVGNMLASQRKLDVDLPPLDILETTSHVEITPADNDRRARLIEEALGSHGIEVKVTQINPGPTVTQFGVEPGWLRKYKEIKERDEEGRPRVDDNGEPVVRQEEISRKRVKVDQIAALDKDLALALAAPSIRIEAPVPGKSLVGIEVPNTSMGLVGLREALENQEFKKGLAKSGLTVALGKGSAGQMVVASLEGMPHLLIAGATGSGKSVCITSLICCLLMHNAPENLRFVLVDPKRVELLSFSTIPHLLVPVVVDMEKVVGVLKWVSQEMDRRYKVMASVAARNISSYNTKVAQSERAPYLVIVIDELADLMSLAPFDVEQSLTRLAQMGRATGIHLVVATQRPSVDVITGLIKANFPTRVSFAVTSMMDSRVILDTVGAEKLLGRGDMLYLPSDAPKPKRLQGVYVSEQEIERIVNFWSSRRPAPTLVAVTEEPQPSIPPQANNGPAPAGPSQPAPAPSQVLMEVQANEDPLFTRARSLTLGHRSVSASLLQRRLGIGYPKAVRLLDQLEEQGLVGPGEPGKSRQVFKAVATGPEES